MVVSGAADAVGMADGNYDFKFKFSSLGDNFIKFGLAFRTQHRLVEVEQRVAMPLTGAVKGTPASISARQLEQVAAIDVEPFWLIISVTLRIAYGKSSSLGNTGVKARSAK